VTGPVGLPGAPDDALPPPRSVVDDVGGALTIAATPFPDWVTAADGSVWVANVGDGVARFDGTTGELLGTVSTGTEILSAMDHGLGSLWVPDHGSTSVHRVSLMSGAIEATIVLPFDGLAVESSIGAGDVGVFVLDGKASTVARIDPATNTVTTTFPAPRSAAALRVADGALWVTSSSDGALHRLDPSGAETAVVPVGAGARFLATGLGAVWVLNSGDGTVSRVDPATDAVAATVTVSPVAIRGGDVAAGGGFVWARVTDVLVAQIDPEANLVVARYGPASGSGGVAADDDAVWISAHDVTTIWRIPIDRSLGPG
jgi:virginiamycin B lyase